MQTDHLNDWHNRKDAMPALDEANAVLAARLTGPQPVIPGPYHAVVRGPNGLDFSLSGDADTVGSQLVALGQRLAAAQHRVGPLTRDLRDASDSLTGTWNPGSGRSG